MYQVHKGHQVIARWPAAVRVELVGPNAVALFDRDGQQLARYDDGEWDGVSDGDAHVFVDDDPACPTCHPATVAP